MHRTSSCQKMVLFWRKRKSPQSLPKRVSGAVGRGFAKKMKFFPKNACTIQKKVVNLHSILRLVLKRINITGSYPSTASGSNPREASATIKAHLAFMPLTQGRNSPKQWQNCSPGLGVWVLLPRIRGAGQRPEGYVPAGVRGTNVSCYKSWILKMVTLIYTK